MKRTAPWKDPVIMGELKELDKQAEMWGKLKYLVSAALGCVTLVFFFVFRMQITPIIQVGGNGQISFVEIQSYVYSPFPWVLLGLMYLSLGTFYLLRFFEHHAWRRSENFRMEMSENYTKRRAGL